jgi:hypothetical protein
MLVKKGDKLVVKKSIAGFFDEGEIVKVTNVDDNGCISFEIANEDTESHFTRTGTMNNSICDNYFEVVAENAKVTAPTITQEYIDCIMENSDIEVYTMFDKCTVVSCKLPNGFVIVESSACVSPENYNEEIGIEICLDKISNKVWELEGYKLQDELYRSGCCGCDCCCEEFDDEDCDGCYD